MKFNYFKSIFWYEIFFLKTDSNFPVDVKLTYKKYLNILLVIIIKNRY